MNVRDLIELLESYDPEATVRLAVQPNWPLQYALARVASAEDIALDSPCEEHGDYNCDECAEGSNGEGRDGEGGEAVVYLVEGGHPYDASPYAPRAAWDVVRTSR